MSLEKWLNEISIPIFYAVGIKFSNLKTWVCFANSFFKKSFEACKNVEIFPFWEFGFSNS